MIDYLTARAQFLKVKRAETRLRFSLMADAHVAENIGKWKLEFEQQARENMPAVLSFENAVQEELRRLTAGER